MTIEQKVAVAGPWAEPAKTHYWQSIHNKEGAHYNSFGLINDEDGMDALREYYSEGVHEESFVLFSTSGVHGTYSTIEEIEQEVLDDESDYPPSVTFLIVEPRICCLRHGNCQPQDDDDFEFLRQLREESWKIAQQIGREDPPKPSSLR